MDISTTLNKTKSKQLLSKKRLVILFLALFITSSLWGLFSGKSSPKLSFDEIRTAQVKQGDFKVKVQGLGRLESKHQRLLTSHSQAVVESIALYPGAKVKADSVILTQLDPALAQSVTNARLALARQKAEYKERIIAHKSQLFQKGIVSTLDYERTLLNVRQLNQSSVWFDSYEMK